MSKHRNSRETLDSISNRDSHRVKVASKLLSSEVYDFCHDLRETNKKHKDAETFLNILFPIQSSLFCFIKILLIFAHYSMLQAKFCWVHLCELISISLNYLISR